jgi:hypothetical protein
MSNSYFRAVLVLSLAFGYLFWQEGYGQQEQTKEPVRILHPRTFQEYFTRFAQQEQEFLGNAPTAPWAWFEANIPWLDVPDKELEELYYFRWYAFQKHIHRTPYGYVIDEFLDSVPWAGKYNAIDAAAGHHIREARWLRDQSYAEQYARFWFSPAGEPQRYSFAAADAVYSVYLANNDRDLAINLLPALVRNYETWVQTHRDSNGLFWQIDDRDGMEDSIGGSGYRPSINSYMYGDAIAISKIAGLAGNAVLAEQYKASASELRSIVETRLWNPKDQFYETIPRTPDAKWVGVRELIGYVPWYFDLPQPDRNIAWEQLTDPQGFAGTFGPTTAERRSPRYRFHDAHECLWNGPSWPFATTQTLVGLANLLNGPQQSIIGPDQYWELFAAYVHSQHIHLSDGQRIPWIDEDLDPDTGEWIARSLLTSRKQLPANRGRYYNHSGFADLVVTGLFGIRPGDGNLLTIHPLLTPTNWSYFALDGLPYHGHLLTVFYDRDGNRYHRGKGLQVLCDGILVATSQDLSPISVQLPSK